MTTPAAAAPARIHTFARAGLGPAPYTFLGVETKTYQACSGAPVQPGGCCDYCGTGIHDQFHLRAADGRTFKVGSDCIRKAGDAGLRRVVTDHERAKRQAKADATRVKATAVWQAARARFEAARATFEALPHPRGFTDRETGRALTLADQVDWMFDHAGTSGCLATARLVDRVLAEAP
jgi:hypothetical protein